MPDLFQPIASDTPFRFHCGPEVTCFNACCRNLNQFLYPYDAARMACSLGLSAASFLARYTRRHIGPETGLPVVSLKPQAGPQQLCPLVTPGGARFTTTGRPRAGSTRWHGPWCTRPARGRPRPGLP